MLKSGKWFGQSVSILSEWFINPKIQKNFLSATIFIRLNVAAFISFSAFPMRPLFKGGVYFEITFLKSLTTVTVNRLYILCTSKVAMFLLIILTRENRNCLDGADYQLVPSFFLVILFWLGAAFIRGRHFLVILLPSAAFNRINTVHGHAYWMFMYD